MLKSSSAPFVILRKTRERSKLVLGPFRCPAPPCALMRHETAHEAWVVHIVDLIHLNRVRGN
jgi:hypothetical protein